VDANARDVHIIWDARMHALRWMVKDEKMSMWVLKNLFNLVVISAEEKNLDGELRAFFISLLDQFFRACMHLWV